MDVKNGSFPLLTYGEAAKLLRLNIQTLRLWVSKRKIPYMKIGSTVRFSKPLLEEYINANLIEAINTTNKSGTFDYAE